VAPRSVIVAAAVSRMIAWALAAVDATGAVHGMSPTVRNLTETMRRLAAELGIASGLHEKHIGLWADRADPQRFESAERAGEPVKIGAIGVRISHWITMHGFALNLDPDLSLYQAIVPCGIREHGVSSIAALGGRSLSVEQAAQRAFEVLAEVTEAHASEFVRGSV